MAEATGIRVDLLTALEQDAFEALPGQGSGSSTSAPTPRCSASIRDPSSRPTTGRTGRARPGRRRPRHPPRHARSRPPSHAGDKRGWRGASARTIRRRPSRSRQRSTRPRASRSRRSPSGRRRSRSRRRPRRRPSRRSRLPPSPSRRMLRLPHDRAGGGRVPPPSSSCSWWPWGSRGGRNRSRRWRG